LQLYDQNSEELEQNSKGLFEYEDRRLSTTWSISVKQVQSHDPEAMGLLRLLAHFDNQDIWYELLQPGRECGLPWLSEVVKSEMRFHRAMAKLHDYSLVDVQPASCSIHACVHDWILGFLNRALCADLHSTAVHCVGRNVLTEEKLDTRVANRRLMQHANRLRSNPLKRLMNSIMLDKEDWYRIGCLHYQLGDFMEAEQAYPQTLGKSDRVWGREHTTTLPINVDLGNAHLGQDKAAEAEQMFLRAVAGYENVHVQEHVDTLAPLNDLGICTQSKERQQKQSRRTNRH
jgi:tetratricopeptide (TPR) repeat protein